ncbi:MAG: autotransporter-associated beta strand repeat-containing protein, partial [Chthoniobacteraceae bacterium]
MTNNGGIVTFTGSATAGAGSITIDDPVNDVGAGLLQFSNLSSAGSALITVNGGHSSGAPGSAVTFRGGSTAGPTAGNATIITNGGMVAGAGGATTVFSEFTDGGTARAVTNAGGTFDISQVSAPGMGIGSIEGAGAYILGSRNLSVGGNNLSTTVSGVIQDGSSGTGGSLTKVGSGTLTLSGANTYTGGTLVNAGTLLAANATGSATGPGAVEVSAGGVLGGNGAIGGNVAIDSGGILSPGNSPGMLTLGGSLGLAIGSFLDIEIGGPTPGTDYDQVFVTGPLTLGGSLRVTEIAGFTLTLGQSFTILDNTGSSLLTTTFANAPGGAYTDAAGNQFLVNYAANADGGAVANDVTLTVTFAVPEPSTGILSGLGLLILAKRRRPIAIIGGGRERGRS